MNRGAGRSQGGAALSRLPPGFDPALAGRSGKAEGKRKQAVVLATALRTFQYLPELMAAEAC